MTATELRAILVELGMNQAQAAAYLRVTDSAVSRWMSAQRAIPGPVVALLERALQDHGDRA